MMLGQKLLLSLGALIQLSRLPQIDAILPTGAIDVKCVDGTCDKTLFASQASFGPWPNKSVENNAPLIPIMSPSDDPLLCSGTQQPSSFAPSSPFVVIAPRGQCSFETKALMAQNLGASGIIVYGTLASRYSLNATTNEVDYPAEFQDYDCDKASANIPMNVLSFDPDKRPYDNKNDPLLSGTAAGGNLCAAQNDNFAETCSSQRCLLTGKVDDSGQTMKACCAWDFHVWLYKDETIQADIKIPAFYLTMEEADELFAYMKMSQVTVTMFRRWYPEYNLASVIIWALGVFVAAIAAWMSASDYRYAQNVNQEANTEMAPLDDRSTTSSNGSNNNGARRYEQLPGGSMVQEESLELSASHAFGFILFSTMGLMTLFIFKIYNVVKVFYAFGCSGAMFQVIFFPLFYRLTVKMGFRDKIAFSTQTLELGDVTYVAILATLVSYGLGTVWTYIAFTQRHPDEILFFWVMQDIMGACMCVMFLAVMKLNSIKVASVLLTAAFFYDIFFVFVTPLLTKEGKSIMVDVATSGGGPTASPEWCERYPDHKDCQGGDPLPMLFTIPRIDDFSGGSSMLGLGDIVLPGLLLSFAARYDEAKRFIGRSSREGRAVSNAGCAGSQRGYFPYLVVAYAIGLAMANAAVYLMKMGQPALLYLVPCCLGTMVYLGRKRGELDDLWENSKVINSCDEILYGEYFEDGQEENGRVE